LTYPSDWGRTLDGARLFKLPEGRAQLLERYTSSPPSPQFLGLLRQLDELGATAAFAESPYVDFDYRTEFSHLYARSFSPPPDKSERLLFFRGQEFLGFSVIRPLHKPVGRTALMPPVASASAVTCLAPHVIRPYGRRLCVNAYPFMSQDGQYGRCAHAAIWSIARYHHLAHSTPKYSIAAVVEAAGTQESVDRTLPSEGLYLHQVADAFRNLGLPALPYDPENLMSGETVASVVPRYLNSGFPVALNTRSHLTVLVGYGRDRDGSFYVRSDDNREAYERIPSTEGAQDPLGDWQMLLVPLPTRIHVPGELAEIGARQTLLQASGATEATLPIRRMLEADELELQTYAVESGRYKERLPERQSNEVVAHHIRVPASSWVWITEFQRRDVEGPSNVVAEVAIDATSHRTRPEPLFANLPHRCLAWLPEDRVPRALDIGDQGLYTSALRALGRSEFGRSLLEDGAPSEDHDGLS
jgi:hypothetical protein